MDEPISKMIVAGRILEEQGQGDYTRGHVSLRCPDDPTRFLMKPQTYGLEEITPENIVTVDLEGHKVAGHAPRHSEAFIHSEVMRVRPDIHAVVHTHPPHAVAFSATGRPLRPIGQPSSVFWRGLPVYSDTMQLVTDRERGGAVAACLGPHKAMLLRNHGIVTAGATIEEAVYLALLLEDACRLQLLAESVGPADALFSTEDVRGLGERLLKSDAVLSTFAYLARRMANRSA